MVKNIFKSPIFWIAVAVVLIYGWSDGWFEFLHRPSKNTPPTGTGYGETHQIK